MTSLKTMCISTLLLLIVALAAPLVAEAKLDEEGCRYPVLADYGAPLERMTPVHPPPGSEGHVPFAPPGVTVRVPTISTVFPGGGSVGFELSGPPVRLDWTVASRLSRVKRSGAVAKVLRSKRQRVTRIHPGYPERSTFQFAVSGRPTFYRFDSTFFDAAGRRLGHYAEYFRILKWRTRYRESVLPRMAHGGDVLVTRTENLGTTVIEFGVGYVIDRFEDGRWIVDPLTPKGFPLVGLGIFGGVIYECHSLHLPADMAPGHYRYRKEVFPVGRPNRDIAADFFVLP